MIWSGPYKDEAACTSYVKKRLADNDYVRNMTAKYGDLSVWSFSCPHLTENLPD